MKNYLVRESEDGPILARVLAESIQEVCEWLWKQRPRFQHYRSLVIDEEDAH